MHTTFQPSEEAKVNEFVYRTPIDGLLFILAKKSDDDRGFYSEMARIPEIESEINISFTPRQLNLSHSKQRVARGIHAENWNKLLTITRGSAFCAWVDFRPESKTFGNVVTATVGTDDPAIFASVFVSRGIGNSFVTLSESLDYVYTVDQLYADRDPSGDISISMFDPELNIPWPLSQDQMIISQRDLTAVLLKERFPI